MINLHIRSDSDAPSLAAQAAAARPLLSGIAKDPMAGWLRLPENYDGDEAARIKKAAAKVREDSDFLVCIGIGGSYLGHRAVIEALGPQAASGTKILYAGNSLSTIETRKVLDEIGDRDFSVCVISKSGTTTEPAIAFRIFKKKLIEKYGEAEAYRRIFVTTDAKKGALHDEALHNGYASFVVPDGVGGRFSVLTAVGLFPIAAAGIDIDELLAGAREESAAAGLEGGVVRSEDPDPGAAGRPAGPASDAVFRYAAFRHLLRSKNFDVEVLASFEPCMRMFTEWWKQLFGESEGKKDQGIFPASAIYTTDLHSLGQYMQQGRPNIFETMIGFREPASGRDRLTVPVSDQDLDGLGYLEGRDLDSISRRAQEATVTAHARHIPVVEIELPDLSARSLGGLIWFFETACAVSATLAGVDPFDQPGVEDYKHEMFRLLGKPGYAENGNDARA